MTTVYLLHDMMQPIKIGYVGATDKTLHQRLYYHLHDKQNFYKALWLNYLKQQGRCPIIHSLGKESAENNEAVYIHSLRSKGWVLLNLTHNGCSVSDGGKPIARHDIESIRHALGLPFTHPLPFAA